MRLRQDLSKVAPLECAFFSIRLRLPSDPLESYQAWTPLLRLNVVEGRPGAWPLSASSEMIELSFGPFASESYRRATARENENDNDTAFLTAREQEYCPHAPHRYLVAARVAQSQRGWSGLRRLYSRCPNNSIEQPSMQELPLPLCNATKSIHTYLIDYPVAIVLMVAPFRLNFGKNSPVALWLSAVTRAPALLPPAFVDHTTGLVRIIRSWLHLWVDSALDAISVTAPSAVHFGGPYVWYCWVLAAAVLLTTSVLSAIEVGTALVADLDTRAIRCRSIGF
jgi:hypothetical protein